MGRAPRAARRARARRRRARARHAPTAPSSWRAALRPKALDGVFYYLALPFRLSRELRRFRPDAVVAQSPYEGAAVLAARLLARSRAKLVLDVHGDWRTFTRLYGSSLRRALDPAADRVAAAVVRRADGVRTVSDYTTGLVRELGREPAGVYPAYMDLRVVPRRAAGAVAGPAAGALRRRARALQERRRAGGGVAAGGAPCSGREAAARRGGDDEGRSAAAGRRAAGADGVGGAAQLARGRARARRVDVPRAPLALRRHGPRRRRGACPRAAGARRARGRDPRPDRGRRQRCARGSRRHGSARGLRWSSCSPTAALVERLAGAARESARPWILSPEEFAERQAELVERVVGG